jgi:hypothetical protein
MNESSAEKTPKLIGLIASQPRIYIDESWLLQSTWALEFIRDGVEAIMSITQAECVHRRDLPKPAGYQLLQQHPDVAACPLASSPCA